jgi:predicted lysophospholipase L1 biosynthesis ABC-type transport system permease subunit
MRLAALGIAIGLITAAALVRLLRHNLAGLQVDDPALIGMAASLVAGTTAVACWVPAWRATRIDSVAAIRQEELPARPDNRRDGHTAAAKTPGLGRHSAPITEGTGLRTVIEKTK